MWHVCLALGVCYTASAARAGFLRRGFLRSVSDGIANESQTSVGTSLVRNELANMVANMIAGSGPGITDMAKNVHKKIDLATAVRQLDGKLPSDVASLVHMTTLGKEGGELDEDSMQKARKILNNMMFAAWGELDDVVFECKEFEERNRGTYEQVVADLARLGSQLSRLGELRVSSQQGISDKDRERDDAVERLDKMTRSSKKQILKIHVR